MTEESPVLFYCKDCQKVVLDPVQRGHRYEYNCPLCNGPKVAFGSRQAVCDFFHIKDAQLEKMLTEQTKK